MRCDLQILYQERRYIEGLCQNCRLQNGCERKSTATWLITGYETYQWVEVYFPVVALGRSCFSKRSSLSLNPDTSLSVMQFALVFSLASFHFTSSPVMFVEPLAVQGAFFRQEDLLQIKHP